MLKQRFFILFLIQGLVIGLQSSHALAAETSAFLAHSLQDDYSSTLAAQQSSSLSLAQVKPHTTKNYQLSWALTMKEWAYQNPLNKENLFKLNADFTAVYHMTSELSMNLTPSFSYFNGFTQTQNEVQSNGSVWTMKNASVDLQPWKPLLLSAGALNQEQNSAGQKLHSAVLMDDRSFPAAAVQISVGDDFSVGILGEAAIPTSASLTTQTGDQEPNPSFQSAGAFFSYHNSRLKIQGLADYFSWNNLPSSVAMQSGLLGNTVETPNGKPNNIDNEFTYDYRGLETAGKASLTLGRFWRANAEGVYIKNSGAPSAANAAVMGSASLDWIAAHDLMLTPIYTYYQIQSDAVVAAYNDSTFMPNMAGYEGKLALQYKKTFLVALSGGERAPLQENANQFHEHFWTLQLEMLNVAI